MRESTLSRRDKTGQEQQDLIRSVQEREHKRNRIPTTNVQSTAAAGSATMYAEQRPWLERTRRPDAPPYLLASAARVLDLFADIVSPYEDEMKINEILNAVDVVIDRCKETVHSTSRNLLCWLKSNHPNILYSKPFTLVKHASSTIKYRSLLKKGISVLFSGLPHGREATGTTYRYLAHDFLVADGIDEVEQLDEDEMHVEYKDMDMNEDVYGDLMNGDDDDNDDDDGDPYNTSEDDNDDDDVYMPIEDDHYQALKSTTSLRKAESLASLAELVFGLSLALYTERNN
ncbi:hypothetical protein FOMA001_g5860 [Fusarium oxysporum f. sp. matthiolae]|nr:hypothetical protein FOMA001_g5860 [Fusarium oxysporum f. sp. matthiolae]